MFWNRPQSGNSKLAFSEYLLERRKFSFNTVFPLPRNADYKTSPNLPSFQSNRAAILPKSIRGETTTVNKVGFQVFLNRGYREDRFRFLLVAH